MEVKVFLWVEMEEKAEDEHQELWSYIPPAAGPGQQPFSPQVSGKEEQHEQTAIRRDKCLSDANCAPHLARLSH